MTLIVALKCPDGVILGADGCLTAKQSGKSIAMQISSSKIEELGQDKLMGFSYNNDRLYNDLKQYLNQYYKLTLHQLKDHGPLRKKLEKLLQRYNEYAGVLIVENRKDTPILEISVNESSIGVLKIQPHPIQNYCVAIGSGWSKVFGYRINNNDIKKAAISVFDRIDKIIKTGGKKVGIDRPVCIGIKNGEKHIVFAETRKELIANLGLKTQNKSLRSSPSIIRGNTFQQISRPVHSPATQIGQSSGTQIFYGPVTFVTSGTPQSSEHTESFKYHKGSQPKSLSKKSAHRKKDYLIGIPSKYKNVLKAYDAVLKCDPTLKEVWFKKGDILGELGRHKEELIAYEKALKLDPENTMVLYNQGVILGELGRHKEELIAYNKALKIDPRYKDAWFNIGFTLDELGRYKEALTAYNKALRIDPIYKKALGNKGIIFEQSGRYKEALVLFNKILKIDPKDKIAWYRKGLILDELGKYKEALIAYNKTLKLDPKYESALGNKGIIFGKTGRYKEALVLFNMVLKIDPKDKEAWYNKGIVLEELGKYKEALTVYNKALRIDPRYKEAL